MCIIPLSGTPAVPQFWLPLAKCQNILAWLHRRMIHSVARKIAYSKNLTRNCTFIGSQTILNVTLESMRERERALFGTSKNYKLVKVTSMQLGNPVARRMLWWNIRVFSLWFHFVPNSVWLAREFSASSDRDQIEREQPTVVAHKGANIDRA